MHFAETRDPVAECSRGNDDLTANKRVRMTAGSSIDYDALTQAALRGVVRMVLNQVIAKGGLPGEHHFYIAFNTQAPGVSMSRRLKEKYPDEMMIVLQHRFWDLAVTEEGFEVKLTFDGIPERLYIPFEALRVFFDPSVRFTLQFGEAANGDDSAEGAGGRRGGRADGSRQGADRRGRNRNGSGSGNSNAGGNNAGGKPRTESAAEPEVADAQPVPAPAASAPAVFAPRPVAVPNSAASGNADAPAKEGGGAKVFSLDQFRKK